MRRSAAAPLLAAALLGGCVAATPPPAALAPAALPAAPPDPAGAAFGAVAARVEPVAEALCRANRPRPANCDIIIAVDDRPGEVPNAFQTLDRQGRPWVVFTRSLIAMARNEDELAFVLGHEAAHHIEGHIPRREELALTGAIIAGTIARATGLSPEDIRAAQDLGADVGARRFSKEFELEADALGTAIAFRAGFDPVRGAAFFDRLPDPGDAFLGTHPPNAQRKAVVAETLRLLMAGPAGG